MTADERIMGLIARSGVMIEYVKNTQETEEEKRAGLVRNIDSIVNEQFDGDVYAFISNLADTINMLECVLENVIVQRDSLIGEENGERILQ